jgi:hypothetical protein
MNVRQSVILIVVLLLGVLTAGAFMGRPVAAEVKGDVATPGRYQIVHVGAPNAAGPQIVVPDTTTGQCWNDVVGDDNWHSMGSPAKGK